MYHLMGLSKLFIKTTSNRGKTKKRKTKQNKKCITFLSVFQFRGSSPENSTYVVMRKSPAVCDPVYCWLIVLHYWIYVGCDETETANILGGNIAHFSLFVFAFFISCVCFFNSSQVENCDCTTDDKQQGETKTKTIMMPAAAYLLISAFTIELYIIIYGSKI